MPDDLPRALSDLRAGSRAALNEVMPAVYSELRRLAGASLSHERQGHTLQPTALVHEVYLRLLGQEHVDWKNRAQLLGLAARMMRRILMDHAESRQAAKRFGQLVRVPLDDDARTAAPPDVDPLDLDRALSRLSELDPRQA